MRALGFLLLFLLPLSAGETGLLARSVAKFKSDHAAERDAASQAVGRFLRAELAPLVAAVRSDDPEVSRRAREAIASLLPPGKTVEQEDEESGGNMIIGIGGPGGRAARNLRFVLRANRKGQLVFVQGGDQKQNEALKKYGLEGYGITETMVRRQLQLADGRGFAVSKVVRETAAARIGLERHDIILSIGGRPVQRADQVVKALGKPETWKRLAMSILRAGKVVALGAR